MKNVQQINFPYLHIMSTYRGRCGKWSGSANIWTKDV